VGDARVRPTADSGYQACAVASGAPPAEGNVGAGAGATVGKLFGMTRAMKSGLGTAAVSVGGFTVGALVAVNALGDIIDPASGRPLSGARTADGERLLHTRDAILSGEPLGPQDPGTATTIGVVATDAGLTKPQAQKMAQMAHDGLARAINPIHTMFDGDTIFALGTGRVQGAADVNLLGILAAEVMARAVVRAALTAQGIEGLPAARDMG